MKGPAIILSLMLLAPLTVRAENLGSLIGGNPRVVDGDTLVFSGVPGKSIRVRMEGIDAPETGQSCKRRNGTSYWCGRLATAALTMKIGARPVICTGKGGEDRYGRLLLTCHLERSHGINLNRWMVKNGWALAYRKYSKRYVRVEEMAQLERRGIWSGGFTAPWDWRREKRKK